MPYELSFKKPLQISDSDIYINDCCWGGDLVTERLLPSISERYEDVERNQEDWGWFIWFRKGALGLAIDVFCDDPAEGAFRVHLTSRQKRWLVLNRVVDTPELDELRDLVVRELEAWSNAICNVVRLDENYM